MSEARASVALDGETWPVDSVVVLGGNETAQAQGTNGEVPREEPPVRHLHSMQYVGQDRFVSGVRQRLRRCECGEERWS